MSNGVLKESSSLAGVKWVVWLLIIVLIGAVGAQGCGRKSSPQPPETTAPAPVKFFSLKGTVDAIVLSWRAPQKDASGDPLLDLSRFFVKRSDYVKDERPDFEVIARIEVSADEQVEEAEPETAKDYTYADSSVEPGSQYEYVVVPVNEEGVEGLPAGALRVSFVGESSIYERFYR